MTDYKQGYLDAMSDAIESLKVAHDGFKPSLWRRIFRPSPKRVLKIVEDTLRSAHILARLRLQ